MSIPLLFLFEFLLYNVCFFAQGAKSSAYYWQFFQLNTVHVQAPDNQVFHFHQCCIQR